MNTYYPDAKDKEVFIKHSKGVTDLKVDILEWDEKSKIITYEVKNSPISEYSQHSRARIGVKFFDYKVSEDPVYIFYSYVAEKMEEDDEFYSKVINTLIQLEREKLSQFSSGNVSDYYLMSRACSYKVTQTLDSLKGQMARRLALCEESFIVGLHWLLRQKMIDMGIEEAKDFKPGCDVIGKCYYSQSDYLSNLFGVLFAGCGRWSDESSYATFNQSCTTVEEMEAELNIEIPKSKYEIKNRTKKGNKNE